MLTNFPVFSIAFLQDNDNGTLVVGGGGGSTKSGIKNRLALYKQVSQELQVQAEWFAEAGADAPMSLAAHPEFNEVIAGVNCKESTQDSSANKNLRRFEIDGTSFSQKDGINSTGSSGMDSYSRACAFSPDGKLVVSGSTNGNADLYSFPALEPQGQLRDWCKEEVYDVDMSADLILVVGASRSCIWSMERMPSRVTTRLLQTIEQPEIKSVDSCTFRAGRFGRRTTKHRLFTVLNTVGKKPARVRKSFLSVWDTDTWQLARSRPIANKAVTAFDIAQDGSLIAYASADLKTGVVDAQTLQVWNLRNNSDRLARAVQQLLFSIAQIHSFPATCLKFDPTAALLVSGSADGSLHVLDVKERRQGRDGLGNTWLLLALLLVMLAVIAATADKRLLHGLLHHVHL